MRKYLALLVLLALSLAACGSSESNADSLAEELPLDEQKPTFIFFYTRG